MKCVLKMLESFIFQLLSPFLINPADPAGKEAYKSGVQEIEDSYNTDRPAMDYPMITIDVAFHDVNFNYLQPGIYAVKSLPETKTLLLLQSGKIMAKSPVIQIIQLDDAQKVSVPSAHIAFIKDNKIFIIYRKDNLEMHGILYTVTMD